MARAVAGALLALAGCSRSAPQADSAGATTATPSSAGGPDTSQPRVMGFYDASGATAPPKIAANTSDRLSGAGVIAPVRKRPQEPSPFRFEEVAKSAGVDFKHFSGMTKEKHFPTANGSGVAIFDYDGDGKMDLYFATCTLLPLGTATEGPNRLYRNLGDGTFKDVTEESGLGFRGFCHGIIAADLDNDGDQDVLLCNYGPNVLFENDGKGHFKDISQAAGVDSPNWSSGGAVIDYDNDGDLDVYVANYGRWKYPDDDMNCTVEGNGKAVRLYCSPRSIQPVQHILYKNLWKESGKLAFVDATKEAGVERKPANQGHGFGVVAADINGDGKVDLYVANDMNPNFLFLNRGDGTFYDATEQAGSAYDHRGNAQSSMGADCEDVDGDNLPELFVTNFQNEPNTLYHNIRIPAQQGAGAKANPSAFFLDQTTAFNLASDSLPWVGWGCALLDFDNDGWPDCFVTNGHVDDNRREIGQPIDYGEPPLLHRNVSRATSDKGPTRRFILATRDVGPYFEKEAHVGRGAGFGDLDDDGRPDIVVSHKDGPPAILMNRTPPGPNHWLRLKLVGTASNRDAVGALCIVELKERTIHRQRKGGCSMSSTNDPRVLIGLGAAPEVVRLTVRWPSGAETVREHVVADKSYEIVEGKP
ncbi:MAG TPA: CRTAC1 family protein [Isosphaeraceae bacterium]|nr:CRTAC1 family protein [Isosphaeraceae bacterium]